MPSRVREGPRTGALFRSGLLPGLWLWDCGHWCQASAHSVQLWGPERAHLHSSTPGCHSSTEASMVWLRDTPGPSTACTRSPRTWSRSPPAAAPPAAVRMTWEHHCHNPGLWATALLPGSSQDLYLSQGTRRQDRHSSQHHRPRAPCTHPTAPKEGSLLCSKAPCHQATNAAHLCSPGDLEEVSIQLEGRITRCSGGHL